jgi:hypothetical protein
MNLSLVPRGLAESLQAKNVASAPATVKIVINLAVRMDHLLAATFATLPLL